MESLIWLLEETELWYLSITTLPLWAGPNKISLPNTNQSLINNDDSTTLKILSLNNHSIHSINRRARFYALIHEHHPDIIITGCKS